jgi:transketolase
MKTPNAKIRLTLLEMVNKGNAAHIGSALSMVEILNAVYRSVEVSKIMEQAPDRDRVILSKGHGTSGLYAVMHHHGLLSKQDIDSYFQNGSVMAGHASHFIDNVEHSTGALGHGLSVGLGSAIGSRAKQIDNRVFVVVGDGELHEGSNWEAIMYAAHQSIGNLCVLVDKNERSQMGATSNACSVDPLALKFTAFGFNCHDIQDGHDEDKIFETIKSTRYSSQPVVIICNTIKGRGISFMEGENIWHYRTPKDKDFQKAVKELKMN